MSPVACKGRKTTILNRFVVNQTLKTYSKHVIMLKTVIIQIYVIVSAFVKREIAMLCCPHNQVTSTSRVQRTNLMMKLN